ncbi:MAG TPA: hypothetical protein ENI17_16780 [Pseudomonas xinjiangensis]|uniref:Energy transducer TonB n=2 Tax=root TaxID=1 RepID=A0A7V1FR04_9GAMM|nr:hypothetical protein [Halopseudomonas xinjiangensis]HEC49258.1 hypothetical protein [Halopseudomonas xinjiangensis]
MREDVRLSYLAAIGVTSWVPRFDLANAATRLPPKLPAGQLPVEQASRSAQSPVAEEFEKVAPSGDAAQLRAMVVIKSDLTAKPPNVSPPANESAATKSLPRSDIPVGPFYMQLWLAGPCALLIEMTESGMQTSSAEYRLLGDILRAAELPTPPRLFADFQWPLIKNRQLNHGASAANEGLQSFMQARLEGQNVKSIGCFGGLATLLVESDPEAYERLAGREVTSEQLAPAWFAPDMETLMAEAGEKARLWHLLRRVRSRWTESE